MSNSNKRRKRDCKVLSRRELYEKYVPHISQDFAKIVDKSKNIEFKQRCQLLLKVDDPSKIQEAITAQLFKLTLGDQYSVNVPRNAKENRGQQSTDQEEIQSCFGDLADHIDDDQWPSFNEHPSLSAEKVSGTNGNSSYCAPALAEVNTHGSCSTMQDTAIRLPPVEGRNDSTKNYELTDIAASVNSDDENFNSLELHAMWDETSWDDPTTGYSEHPTVPCGNINSTMKKYQPVLQSLDARREGIAFLDRNAIPSSNVSSTIQTIPQQYQTVLQQSSTSRKHGTIPDRGAISSGNIRSIIQTIPQQYQTVLQQSSTSRKHGTIPDRGAISSGNIRSTMQKIPQYNQPISHQSDTSRTRTVLPDGDALPCGNIRSTIVPIPQYYQQVLQRSGTNIADCLGRESDDSHFETLGNLF